MSCSKPNPSPRDELNRLVTGFWTTQAIYVAVRLKIADRLVNGPLTAESLASETGSHAPTLYRLLRALASSGVFHEDAQRRFTLTPISELLRHNVPGSMAALALMRGDWQYRAWGELLHSVQTGECAFEHAFGEAIFAHLARVPEHGAIFDQAMVGVHGRETDAMLAAYDFSQFGQIADVGGGNGSVLIEILKRSPSTRGLLFDQPHVIQRAQQNFTQAGLAHRCDFVAGDFFQDVPPGADAYLLRHIIHDWDNDRSKAILRNCHRAMSAGSRLLIAEFVLPNGPGPFQGKWFDLAMLAVTGGQERTETEYRALLADTDFQWRRLVSTSCELSIIEADR